MDALPLAGQAHRAMTDFVRAAGRRRQLPRCLHVGVPGLDQIDVLDRDWFDPGTRTDLVCRCLEGLAAPEPIAWVSRTGPLDPGDADLSWLAACRHAFARHRLRFPGLFLVTRRGWANLSTGEQHQWSRVRPRC